MDCSEHFWTFNGLFGDKITFVGIEGLLPPPDPRAGAPTPPAHPHTHTRTRTFRAILTTAKREPSSHLIRASTVPKQSYR